jgi:hypothetical protein
MQRGLVGASKCNAWWNNLPYDVLCLIHLMHEDQAFEVGMIVGFWCDANLKLLFS